MPFGESMNSILKSNKGIMLDKSLRFRKTAGRYDGTDKEVFDFPEVTPKVLKTIRDRLKKEHIKLLWKRRILNAVILITAIVAIALYQKSH